MDDLLRGEENAAFLHIVKDDGVGFIGLEAGVLAGIIGVAALIVHGDDHFHAVAHAGLIVVSAEAGSGMDAAGTGIHSDVISQHEAGGLWQEGMRGQHILEKAAGVGLDDLIAVKAADLHDLIASATIYISPFGALTTA